MTFTQLIAYLLYTASLDISLPAWWRYTAARRQLTQAMRGDGRSWMR